MFFKVFKMKSLILRSLNGHHFIITKMNNIHQVSLLTNIHYKDNSRPPKFPQNYHTYIPNFLYKHLHFKYFPSLHRDNHLRVLIALH